MVVKPTMILVVAESHDREEKRENSLQKKKLGRRRLVFFNFWIGFSPCSSHEIHSYLLGVGWGGKG
jgi:hypothetical protein